MKKIIMLAMLAMLALTCCFAEKYNGFEVRKGYGDVEVLNVIINGRYMNKDEAQIMIELPLVYYKAIEKQLKEIDTILDLPDEKIKTTAESELNKPFKAIKKITDLDDGYLTEEEFETINTWGEELFDTCYSEEPSAREKADEFYERFDKFNALIQKFNKNIEGYLGEVCFFGNSTKIKEELKKDEKYKTSITFVKEAFPSIKLSSLGL